MLGFRYSRRVFSWRSLSSARFLMGDKKPLESLSTGSLFAKSGCVPARSLSCGQPSLAEQSDAQFSQIEKRVPDYKQMSRPHRLMIRLIAGYRDYGLTALTFHAVFAGFSLASLWYLIYSGYDVVGVLARMGFVSPLNLLLSHVQQTFGASTFPLAFSIHKAFAPVRVAITAIATPFIVKRLRKEHIFKLPPGMRP